MNHPSDGIGDVNGSHNGTQVGSEFSRLSKSERRKLYPSRSKAAMREQNAKWASRKRAWAAANRAKVNAAAARYRARMTPEQRARERERLKAAAKRRRDTVSDWYVMEVLFGSRAPLMRKVVPKELIETQRTIIQIKRLCQNPQT